MTARIALIGAGAVGCTLAGILARGGVAVTLVARGNTLEALRQDGLVLEQADGRGGVFPVEAMPHLPDTPFDLIVLALKSQDLPSIAPLLAGRPEPVLPVVNGVPFWFPRSGGAMDPDGALARALPRDRILGCASFMMASTVGPGRVRCDGTPKLRLGAVTPALTERAARIAAILRGAGLAVDLLDDPAEAVWGKLIVNAATNPLSVIAGATLRDMHRSPRLRLCVETVAEEMTRLGRTAGLALAREPENCARALAAAGDHLTSMKQDFDAGRPLEIEAICSAPLRMAEALGVAMPASAALFALTIHLADNRTQARRPHGS